MQRKLRLHQALAESGLPHDPGAVVILQRPGDDLGGRSRMAVHQHHHGILLRRGHRLGAEHLLRSRRGHDAKPPVDPSRRNRPATRTASLTSPPGLPRRSRISAFDVVLAQLRHLSLPRRRPTFCASKLSMRRKTMPGFTQNASTRLVSISPRVTSTVIGSVDALAPHRHAHLGAARPAQQVGHVGRLQTGGILAVHRRQSCRRAAGPPGTPAIRRRAASTITLVPSMPICMPTPKYCARCRRCISRYSAGSTKLECGSSVCSMPGMAP